MANLCTQKPMPLAGGPGKLIRIKAIKRSRRQINAFSDLESIAGVCIDFVAFFGIGVYGPRHGSKEGLDFHADVDGKRIWVEKAIAEGYAYGLINS